MRADVFLFSNGHCKSREQARKLIEEGYVLCDGKPIKKPSTEITEGKIEITHTEPYVSRGGIKLAEALEKFSLDVTDAVCVDIGASSGGFTDCLLKHGAKKVYAVDCGKDQLVLELRNDERVVSMESFNARNLTFEDIGECCDIAVMDVSFISQSLLYGAVKEVLAPDGVFVSLIKPQFEVGRAKLSKKGIVRDEKARLLCIKELEEKARLYGLIMKKTIPSPIKGGDGNTEYLSLFVKEM